VTRRDSVSDSVDHQSTPLSRTHCRVTSVPRLQEPSRRQWLGLRLPCHPRRRRAVRVGQSESRSLSGLLGRGLASWGEGPARQGRPGSSTTRIRSPPPAAGCTGPGPLRPGSRVRGPAGPGSRRGGEDRMMGRLYNCMYNDIIILSRMGRSDSVATARPANGPDHAYGLVWCGLWSGEPAQPRSAGVSPADTGRERPRRDTGGRPGSESAERQSWQGVAAGATAMAAGRNSDSGTGLRPGPGLRR
jgi:hypothetical protein